MEYTHEDYAYLMSGFAPSIALEDLGNRFSDQFSMEDEKLEHAIESFAPEAHKDSVIGLYDTSLFGNCGEGYLFTDEAVFYKECFSRRNCIKYADIVYVRLEHTKKNSDYNKHLVFAMKDGSKIVWEDSWLNKTELLHFFNLVLSMVRGDDYYGIYDSKHESGTSDEQEPASPNDDSFDEEDVI